MAKNALIICNFRLRNRDEFNNIVKNFKNRKYEVFDIGEIDRENFTFDILERKIAEIRTGTVKYEIISVISNIKDVLFIWYRIYNNLVDNFIFFIDKINYNILKKQENSDIYMAIANFNGIEYEKLNGKLYININYINFESVFEFLFREFKFRYFESLDNIQYLRNKIKEENKTESKIYLFNSKIVEVGNGDNKNNICLEKKIETNKEKFYLYIYDARYFFPFYALFVIKNYSADEAREVLLNSLKNYNNVEYEQKETLGRLLLNTIGFGELSFKEKIGILSINLWLKIKKHEMTTTPLLEEILKDEGKSFKYYYYIIINIIFDGYYLNKKTYNTNIRKILDLIKINYEKNISYDFKYNLKTKKILIIQDSLKGGNYSGTKLIFDIALNIKKYNPEYEILIYCEDNFFGRQDENLMILDFNNRVVVSSTEYKKEHNEYIGNQGIKIIYSQIDKSKEERVKELIEFAKCYSPEIIITTTIYSYSINILYELFPTIYLSLAEINSANNFDVYLLPHIEHLKRMIDTFGINFDPQKMISFDYGGNFLPSIKKGLRSKIGFKESDFILITVGVRLRADLYQKYVDLIVEFLIKNSNVKWLIVGEVDIPTIDIKYRELIDKNIIIKMSYIEKLGEIYQECNLYLNPPRLGGGFSMSEAIVNDLCILTLQSSPAGALHCGIENGVSNLQEYAKELEELYKDKKYRNEKLKREQYVQKSLSYKNLIPKLMEHIETAKKFYFERKGMKNE